MGSKESSKCKWLSLRNDKEEEADVWKLDESIVLTEGTRETTENIPEKQTTQMSNLQEDHSDCGERASW